MSDRYRVSCEPCAWSAVYFSEEMAIRAVESHKSETGHTYPNQVNIRELHTDTDDG